jgi:hypothetical protein
VISPEVSKRLLYRSQFVLGPRFVEGLEGWTKIRLGHGLCLAAHADLTVTQAHDAAREIILLGYMLDPFDPGATDADVVDRLLREEAGGADLLLFTARFGGRWILIVDDGSNVNLFHDASGLRQVFHTDVQRTGEVWCASQPGIVAEALGLEMNADAVALIESDTRPAREYRLPDDLSLFHGIKRLLPNHSLDLATGIPHRYWPLNPLEPLEFKIAVEKASAILVGLMDAASRRFPLAISMTGGRDSRLVLAASRRIVGKASFVTVAKPGRSEDVETPARLLPRLGLEHTIIPWPSDVDEEFARIFRRNVPLAHEVYVPEAYAAYTYNELTKVAVTGSVAELVRPPRRLSRFGEDNDDAITAMRLSTNAHMGPTELSLATYNAWLATVPRLGTPSVLDLHRMEGANWLATTQTEFDTAWRDVFTPYNCRLLIQTMLAVNRNLRCGPRYRLTEALIRNLWPDVRREPFLNRTKPAPITPARLQRAARLAWRNMMRAASRAGR